LIGGHLLHESCRSWECEWQECTSRSSIHCLMGTSSQPMVERLHE
jgi:hypothetical protein